LDSYRISTIQALKHFAEFHKPKIFAEIQRQDIVDFLDSFRKPESVDTLHKWIGTYEFNRFVENIEGITPKVLTERLRELQELGIIRRRIVSEYPIRVEYELTDLGREFEPVLLAAASFSMKNMPKIVFKDGRPRNPTDLLIQRL
jgi:DNA-binding HxlR family transcriptional regulator